MTTIERPVHPIISARQARMRRNYLRNLQGFSIARRLERPPIVIRDRMWVLWVAILSAPSLVFLLLYILWVPDDLARFRDLGLTQALVISSLFGPLSAFAAFVVTMIASLRGAIANKTKIALWILVLLSLASWLYMGISFSILVHVPLVIPLNL